jgi:hypothetical protein
MSAIAAASASSAPPAPPLRLLGHNQQRRLLSLQRIASHIASLPGGAPPAHLSGVYQFGVLHGFGLRAWLEAMPMLNLLSMRSFTRSAIGSVLSNSNSAGSMLSYSPLVSGKTVPLSALPSAKTSKPSASSLIVIKTQTAAPPRQSSAMTIHS